MVPSSHKKYVKDDSLLARERKREKAKVMFG
jgi:hypothetical protein